MNNVNNEYVICISSAYSIGYLMIISEGHGLLPGRLAGTRGGLGREDCMADSGRESRKGKKKKFDGNYDSECSGNSNLINNRRSGAKSGPR